MKYHYYLMAGQVRYQVKDIELTVNLNTLLQNEEQIVIMKDIGQTQQAMQVRFFREVMEPSPDVKIKDVFIQAVNYLGYMTPEQFNAQPEPMASDTPAEDKPAQNSAEGVVETGKASEATDAPEESETPVSDDPTEAGN